MGVCPTLNQAVDATTISSSEYNSNFNNVRSSVNNIVADQITDGTITNAEISSSAEIAMSKITATASDATLQNTMENFIDGCFVYRVDSTHVGVSIGSVMINGELRRITSIVSTEITAPDNDDWLDVWALADTATSTFTVTLVDSGTSPGGSSNPGTNGRMLGSIKYDDGTAKINLTINYRQDRIIGWDYKVGNNSSEVTTTIVFGKTFAFIPILQSIFLAGLETTVPTTPGSFNYTASSKVCQPYSVSTTGASVALEAETGITFASTYFWGFAWEAIGKYS